MDSLVIRVFRQLSQAERRQLCELVRCPYFNKRKEVIRICDYLAVHTGRSSRKHLSQQQIFAAAYPGVAYDNKRLRHLQSDLLDLVRQFLVLQEVRADQAVQTHLLLRTLRRRRMDNWFERTWSARASEVERSMLRDAQYHFQKYQLHQERLETASLLERSSRLNLQPLPDELTTYYVSEMLRHACLASMHEAVAGQAYRLGLLEAILEAVERDEMLRIPTIAVYYYAYQTLRRPEDNAPLEKLKICLDEHGACFSGEEQSGLYMLAINGCIRRMNAGQRAFIRDALDLYRAALGSNLLLENGILSGFNYKNIIRLAIAQGEREWALHFLEQYRQFLHPRERENWYRYNLAYLYFQQHDYARAMPLLQQIELDDPLNNLDARRMLLRIYYELGEWQALESLLQSFSAYLRRQKSLGYHKVTNENLLIFTRKLVETSKKDRKALQALRSAIESTTEVAERSWLLAQLEV